MTTMSLEIRQPRSRLVFNVGRYRLMLRLTRDPRAFRWSVRRLAFSGLISFGFGFGMGTLLRRDA